MILCYVILLIFTLYIHSILFYYAVQVMETHLKQLELKFSRREADLKGTVDDIRTSAKMERARLFALHQQVCVLGVKEMR